MIRIKTDARVWNTVSVSKDFLFCVLKFLGGEKKKGSFNFVKVFVIFQNWSSTTKTHFSSFPNEKEQLTYRRRPRSTMKRY